ncbi:MerR family transcriptional regulator [Deferribacterales bacterium Es71-Z0220]|jgi:DNA-binding transcriptional MerR regulator|uniref:MerR family transcriptional regulator n=1 Tax=Deferrivibrio essentukiensis TaxID=2880922 RepID=UPI001F61B409|nr:MerR family transcriptional regulator [Deferrivibrio essentukiensis]MCB4204314.1 MerR family transcriptional regulator [Deferrivibrio essentukiensis]
MKIEGNDYFQIGEVATMLGVTTRTIRYYEEIGLMTHPKRLDGGIRVYDKDDIKRLKFILKLKELGISLKEMQELADIYKVHQTPDNIMPKLVEILDAHISKIDAKIAKLASLRNDILEYKAKVIEVTKLKFGG